MNTIKVPFAIKALMFNKHEFFDGEEIRLYATFNEPLFKQDDKEVQSLERGIASLEKEMMACIFHA